MELFLQQLVNGLITGSTYAVVALGFSLVFTVMGVVNVAHPDFAMLAMFLGLLILAFVTQNPILVLFGVLITVAILGLVLERTVLRPVRGQDPLMSFIATAGVSSFLMYTVAGIFGADVRPFPPLIPSVPFAVAGISITSLQLTNAGAAFLIMAWVSYYVRRTTWGRATRAVAERPEVTAAFGVDVNRVAQLTVVLSALMAGVAGISLAMLYHGAWAFVGQLYALKSFVCALVAGNRQIEGVMAVGLLLGVVEALVTTYVSSALRDAVAFALLVVVLYFRPTGLFGSYEV